MRTSLLFRMSVAAAALGAAVPTVRARGPAPFVVVTNAFVIGQASDWLDQDRVVWHEPFGRDEGGDGQVQIYRSTLEGTDKVCLTCGLDGPNELPVVRPQKDWVLFHSWSGHSVRVGAPGFGGLGSDVWVMTPDGGRRTNLTRSTEFHDNFHAYWSPDGNYVVWTSLNWNSAEGGNGKSDVRVARFVPGGASGPHLVDEHVVRPGNGHWYETQWWAPDGSGFLYTETADTAINPELFFCRLPSRSHGECRPERLTTNPAWDEQAIFTPDMSRIIFMSSRDLPGAHNDWAQVATFLDLPADFDYALILTVFSDDFLQPVLAQATDLWEITLRWNRGHTRFKGGPLRRLTETGVDGWVIPEFSWDPSGTLLLWTQNNFAGGRRVDQGCIMRAIRQSFIARLSAVQSIGQLPLDIGKEIRGQAASLLNDPPSYAYQGPCGGTGDTSQKATLMQETRIGHYAE